MRHHAMGSPMLLVLVLFVLLAALAIRFAKVAHVVLIVLFLGTVAGVVTYFASGYVIQAKAR
jgi:hypothetical protein